MTETFKAVESYVLNSDIENSLKTLVPGSEEYLYIKYLHSLIQGSLQFQPQIKEYCKKEPDSPQKRKLHFRLLNLLYDQAKSKEEKYSIIDELRQQYFPIIEDAKPSDLKSSKLNDMAKEKKESSSYLKKINASEEYDKIYSTALKVSDFPINQIAYLNFLKLTDQQFGEVLSVCDNYDGIANETFFSKYKSILEKEIKAKKYSNIPVVILQKFTLEQLEIFQKLMPFVAEDPSFIGEYLEKRFAVELDSKVQEHLTYQEKMANLKKIYDYSKSLSRKFAYFKSDLLTDMLSLMMKENTFDEAVFRQLLDFPPSNEIFKQKKAMENTVSLQSYMRNMQNLQTDITKYRQSTKNASHELMSYCLIKMFEKGHKIDEFYDNFRKGFLISTYEEWKFLKGDKVEVSKYNKGMLEKLTKSVEIEICPYNKDLFKIGEEVNLFLNLKNIPILYVKVFEINTENYYKKNLAPFRTDINLDGLISSFEFNIEYKQPPQILHQELLAFPQLKEKIGLFVIELMGNGKSSRAVLKKGTLSIIEKPIFAGQCAFILDAERKVVNNPESGIWMENKLFKCNPEKNGRIIMPYVDANRTSKAVLLHNGISQLVDVNRITESYSVTCAFLLYPECVLMGKKAVILAKPNVLINGRKTDFKILQNCKIELFSANFIDGIPMTQSFNKFEVKPSEEIEIPFQVPPHLKELRVEFTCDIMNITMNKKDPFKISQDFRIVSNESSYTIFDLYLRKILDCYEISLLGKNGEPLSNCNILLEIDHEIHRQCLRFTLATNEEGKILIAASKEIRQIRATVNMSSGDHIIKAWTICNKEDIMMQQNYDILEDETLEIPFVLNNYNNANVSLTLTKDGKPIRSYFNNILLQDKCEHYKLLTITALKEGQYRLRIGSGVAATIEVHRGVYWETEKFILKQYSLLETIQQAKPIKISETSFIESKEGKKLLVKVDDFTPSTRVHVIMSQFIVENSKHLVDTLKSSIGESFSKAEYHFQQWHNFFLSNRELGDELRYVFDRRNLERYTGNTLDKPKLLLKRLFIQTTTTDKESIRSSTSYDRKAEQKQVSQDYYPMMQQCIAPPSSTSYSHLSKCNDMPPTTSYASYGQERYRGISKSKCDKNARFVPPRSDQALNNIYYLQNFISIEPYVANNLKLDANGIVQVQLNDASYNYALIIAVDSSSIASVNMFTSKSELKKRNLAQTDTLDSKKNYCETRNAINALKHNEMNIDDLTSTEYILIDSLDRLTSAQRKLSTLRGVNYTDDFSFLIEWSNYSTEEKNKKLTKFSSHELHLFIKRKDPVYFKSVVEPYLKNKMEKTFVDFYLLEDYTSAEAETHKFNYMNELEKCLLLDVLVKQKKLEKANELLLNMEYYNEINKTAASLYNQMFDTILSLNKMKDIVAASDNIASPGASILIGAAPPMPPSNQNYRNYEPQMQQQAYNLSSNNYQEMNQCNDDFVDEVAERKIQRSQFEEMEGTKEYAETNYYGIKHPSEYKRRVLPNPFWLDYAKYIVSGNTTPFLSSNFMYNVSTETERIATISLLDLQSKSEEHGFKTTSGRGAIIKAASNLILFLKEIKESKAEMKSNILIIQRYHSLKGNRDTEEIEEFITNEIYSCEVVITNITSKKLEFQYLVQIPEGSLPVKNSPFMKSYSTTLNSYTTMNAEYYFYFPSIGTYKHFGPTVSIDSTIVAKAQENVLKVVKEKTILNTQNFMDVIITGEKKSILNFIREKNILDSKTGYQSRLIFWLLKEKEFYSELINIMRKKSLFERRIWEYGFLHHDEQAIYELFENEPNLISNQASYIKSSLVLIEPSIFGIRHLDYYPLINARAHRVGDAQKVMNRNLKTVYQQLIEYLFEKKSHTSIDQINLCYYLLLQDRVTEGIAVFKSIKKEELCGTVQIQYDYMMAYIDFYVGAPEYKAAKEVVDKYLNYPVISWRLLMIDMKEQLKEYEGKECDTEINREEEESKARNKRKTILTEPQLSIDLEGKNVTVDYMNIESVIFKYYIIDLEILFSRSPFLAKNTEDFSYVKPHSIEEVKLLRNQQSIKHPIPDEYVNKNVVIEVSSQGQQKFQTYFSNSLKVHVFENYGEVKVTDSASKPLSKVYAKVFAETTSGSIEFYKDGYTDIRGRFDYVSLNTQDMSSVKRFALFIMSDQLGSVIKECNPPKSTMFKETEGIIARSKASQSYLKANKFFEKPDMECIERK